MRKLHKDQQNAGSSPNRVDSLVPVVKGISSIISLATSTSFLPTLGLLLWDFILRDVTEDSNDLTTAPACDFPASMIHPK